MTKLLMPKTETAGTGSMLNKMSGNIITLISVGMPMVAF